MVKGLKKLLYNPGLILSLIASIYSWCISLVFWWKLKYYFAGSVSPKTSNSWMNLWTARSIYPMPFRFSSSTLFFQYSRRYLTICKKSSVGIASDSGPSSSELFSSYEISLVCPLQHSSGYSSSSSLEMAWSGIGLFVYEAIIALVYY